MKKKYGAVLGRDDVGSEVPLKGDATGDVAASPLFSRTGVGSGTNTADEPDVEEMVLDGRQRIGQYEGVKDTAIPTAEVSSDEVKEFLSEKVGNLTIEGTIHEMYMTIKGMETQLRKVLDINASLEDDLKKTKDELTETNKVNSGLREKIESLENEGPARKELDMELQDLISQHNRKQEEAQDAVKERRAIGLEIDMLKRDLARLNEEKNDSISDALVLKVKVEGLASVLKERDARIKKIVAENADFRKMLSKRESELAGFIEENKAILLEHKESKEAFDEIYKALIGAKIKTKKFFTMKSE